MSDFAQRVLEAVRLEAERRNLPAGWHIAVAVLRGGTSRRRRHEIAGRSTLPSLMSAVSEAAEHFSGPERVAFDNEQTLPEWFWPWVADRARWWDANTR